jgi:uncharacterized protein
MTEGSALRLLVWDAPNIDATLAGILGNKPTRTTRPDYEAVARWLVGRSGTVEVAEAIAFVNVPPQLARNQQSFVHAIRSVGFGVFARPKLKPDDDIDDALVNVVADRAASHRLVDLVVATHDQALLSRVTEAAGAGTTITQLGFEEHAFPPQNPGAPGFVDLEDVPGVFAEALPRLLLSRLPREGVLFPPLRPLALPG